ncbi:E3 ubiquitin-protein ligase TRIM33-like [Dreissena polymorpha]|uniref:B box-type domain-containing protein n=1 Tax=Dreissena polymorpha TaxID=45954 RepID=A0A9D4FQA5_DREPO|nr:E3 ubiquitin-protein ligase TRIM33-like [Dreissena polymorpha]KAH3803033.1 hypothetical protein DPMN_156731 [Dreissena polymorpha]
MADNNQMCGQCLRDNTDNEGVVYCTDCEEPLCDSCKRNHAINRASMNHKFCDFAEAPPKEMQGYLKNLIACPKHEREEAVYLCKDHDVTCCSKCETADHRKCKEVKVLSDTTKAMKGDFSELKTVLHELQQQGEILLEQEGKHMESISESENKALSWLETTKQKLLAVYNQLEKDFLSEIAGRKKLIEEQVQAHNQKLHHFLQDIKQQSDLIETVEKVGTNEHVFLLQRQLEQDAVCHLKSTSVKLKANQRQSLFQGTVDTRFDSWLTEI